MKFLDNLENRWGHLGIRNVILGLVVAQLVVYALMLSGQLGIEGLILNPFLVVEGNQYWRLITFVICPPFLARGAFDALFLGLFWYIFWMMSQSLENQWGVFRFNLYLLAGVLFTLLGTFAGYFIAPDPQIFVSPRFLYTSVFLAFAVLNPEIKFYVFFILPIKVKWLAWFIGVFALLGIILQPSWGGKLAALGPFLNFILFFHRDLLARTKAASRSRRFEAEKRAKQEEPFHFCTYCDATDRSHPELSFRYKEVEGELICICDLCRERPTAPSS